MTIRQRVAQLASDPVLGPKVRPLLKTAAVDIQQKASDRLHKLASDYEARVEKALKNLEMLAEKELLKIDLVMDRRATQFEQDDHHEGPRFEGTLAFIDKRDHTVRSREQLRADLEKIGFYYATLTQDGRGVWKFNFGG